MDVLIQILQSTLLFAIPLIIVGLGGLMAEKSGVTNIALEGIMLMGAFIGIWVIQFLQMNFNFNPQIVLMIGILVGGIVGLLYAWIHAFASIKMNADQTISATALNLFAPAFAIFTARSIIGGQQVEFNSSEFIIQKIPFLGDIPFIGEVLFQRVYISLFLAVALLIAVWVVLYKSKLGLRLRAVGENPQAAQSLGINVSKIRYIGVLTSGFFAGMGGVVLISMTSITFDATVAGMGFLAIAVLIFGNWKPFGILLAAILFGIFSSIVSARTSIPFLNELKIPTEFVQMLPFLVTLLILSFTSNRSLAPKALGQVFDQGKR